MHRAEREVHLSEQHGTSGQDIEYWGVVVQARTTATLHVIDASGGERVLRSSAWCARWSCRPALCALLLHIAASYIGSVPRKATS